MSEKARAWARKQTAPCSASKAVLLELAAMANADDVCWPSNRCLATVLQVTPRTIQRSLSKLKALGLILVSARSRDNGGQTSNLYRLPIDGVNDVPPRDAYDARPVTQASPQERKTRKKDTSDEVSQASEHDGAFERWWSHYPKKVGMRGAAALFAEILRCGRVTAATLLEAARGYAAAVRGRDLKFVKHPVNWLREECWDEQGAASSPAPEAKAIVSYNGPEELRSMVRRQQGAAWTSSWFDPCVWIAATPAIVPRTGLAAQRIRREIGVLLREAGVGLHDPKTAPACF